MPNQNDGLMKGNAMSDVDRLSTSGTYPALPMAAKRRAKEDSSHAGGQDRRPEADGPAQGRETGNELQSPPKPPTSLIDEYA